MKILEQLPSSELEKELKRRGILVNKSECGRHKPPKNAGSNRRYEISICTQCDAREEFSYGKQFCDACGHVLRHSFGMWFPESRSLVEVK